MHIINLLILRPLRNISKYPLTLVSRISNYVRHQIPHIRVTYHNALLVPTILDLVLENWLALLSVT